MSEPSPGPNTTMRPLMRASSRPTGRRDRAIALSDAAMSARCGDHELTSEDAAYLRDRVAMHLSIGGAVGALFLLAAILYGVLVELVSLEAIILHLAAVVLVGAVVLFLRIRPPSAKASRIGEAVGLFGSFVFYGTIAALNGPDLFPVETLILIYCMALIGRSVFTPSTAVQTGVLAAITASPFVGVTVFRAAESTGPFWSELLLPLVWYVAIGGLAVAVSRVTFGLRSEVQAAKRLGQYTLVEKIGEGGMGWVYRGHHAMLRRDTAIKIMSDPADGGKTARRFEREVRLTARLSHPNTVTVFDYGRTKDGLFYYAMELIDGATLQDIVEKTGPMEPSRVVHVLRQVASALGEAHDLGLIHRDIKPTNIMLARVGGIRDVAKVLDFGLVRDLDASGGTRSEANTVVGTPDYMAPELINNPDEVDHRADLYALGAVGYYLLTGQRLFEAGSAIEVCAHQLH
ncbi:MAG: serine/threonine-protein kinase, partial [Myxococcota bacterium]